MLLFSLSLVLTTFLQELPSAIAAPYPFGAARQDYTNIGIRGVDIVSDLGPQLSPNASIITPDEPEFGNLTARYSAFRAPTFIVVVNPGVESDIAIIVCFPDVVTSCIN
jgi:hypothetical protein